MGGVNGLVNERRAAFLAGEGTLTLAEVREWAAELKSMYPLPTMPGRMAPSEPLMVSVVAGGTRT